MQTADHKFTLTVKSSLQRLTFHIAVSEILTLLSNTIYHLWGLGSASVQHQSIFILLKMEMLENGNL